MQWKQIERHRLRQRAENHQSATRTQRGQTRGRRFGGTDGENRNIHRCLGRGLDRFDAGDSSEAKGLPARDQDAARASLHRQSRNDVAKRPVARNQHFAFMHCAGASDGLQANGDRFEQCANRCGHLFWQPPYAVGPLDKVFRERAVAVIAEMPHARAEMAETTRTLGARTARHHGMNGNPPSHGEFAHVRSARDHHARRFVAEHARHADAERIAREVVQVRRANRRRKRAYEHVARPRCGHRQRGQREFAEFAHLQSLHGGGQAGGWVDKWIVGLLDCWIHGSVPVPYRLRAVRKLRPQFEVRHRRGQPVCHLK